MNIGIIGAGGWGTALACVLADNGYNPLIWCFEKDTADSINFNRTNADFLPGVILPLAIKATSDMNDLNYCDTLVISTPTQHIRSTVLNNPRLFKNKKIINVAKGIEIGSMYRISEILRDAIGLDLNSYAVLSGPSHAEEVSRKVPTAVVAASDNSIFAGEVQAMFNNNYFRVYSSYDVIGCELGGALKNVIAVAAGILAGAGFGDNTQAALITRGMSEMTRLGVAIGAQQNTFFGLSGIGDLFVTCGSKLSRNRTVGESLGRGEKLNDIIANMKMVAEGVHTTRSAFELSQAHKIEMPITEQVHKVLFEDYTIHDSMLELMSREIKREWL